MCANNVFLIFVCMIALVILYRFSIVSKPFYLIGNWATLSCEFDTRVLFIINRTIWIKTIYRTFFTVKSPKKYRSQFQWAETCLESHFRIHKYLRQFEFTVQVNSSGSKPFHNNDPLDSGFFYRTLKILFSITLFLRPGKSFPGS